MVSPAAMERLHVWEYIICHWQGLGPTESLNSKGSLAKLLETSRRGKAVSIGKVMRTGFKLIIPESISVSSPVAVSWFKSSFQKILITCNILRQKSLISFSLYCFQEFNHGYFFYGPILILNKQTNKQTVNCILKLAWFEIIISFLTFLLTWPNTELLLF